MADLAASVGITSVNVALGDRSYEIAIAPGCLSEIAIRVNAWLSGRGLSVPANRRALIVTDDNIRDRHARPAAATLSASGYDCRIASLPPGEETKSLQSASTLFDVLVAMQADRQTVVAAVGCGVIGDLAGFVAATYARGLPFIQVPTTLLAQVDSSVGGKVGVNHPRGKNLIGAFYQPVGVLIDTALLETLTVRDYRAGQAEVIKYGVILDAAFFEFLEGHLADLNSRNPAVLQQAVARSCRLKADVVERDEQERTGLRAVLNYGHTFAHAYEALCGYGQLLHGEAVAIGMVTASRLAERLGRIGPVVTSRQIGLLDAVGLPTQLPDSMRPPVKDILERMQLDKKTVGGRLRFVLPSRLGQAELVNDVPVDDVRAVLEMG